MLFKVIMAAALVSVSNVPDIEMVSPGEPVYLERVIPVAAETEATGSVEINNETVNKMIRGI